MAGLYKTLFKIIFEAFPAEHGFVGGELGAAVILTVLIREGRSADYKRQMLLQLWLTLKRATGATDAEILVAIEEAPASQAMEMGQIMPNSARSAEPVHQGLEHRLSGGWLQDRASHELEARAAAGQAA